MGQRPIIGVVGAPVRDELYWAGTGLGAFLTIHSVTRPLKASTCSMKDSRLRIVASRSHRDERTEAYIRQFDQPEIRSVGSSLKLLLLAAGEADIYPRLAPTMEWDTAAAHMILLEAGGQVQEADSGQPLLYNKPNRLNPYFIATGRMI